MKPILSIFHMCKVKKSQQKSKKISTTNIRMERNLDMMRIRNKFCCTNLKILIALYRTSSSIIEKMAKQLKKLQFFKDFSKVLVQMGHIMVTVHSLDNNSLDSKARHSLDSKICNFTYDIAWTT
jgi:hypothetical protein